ncbi:universal stress protein [Streptomyces sp. CB02959]|uniref:universal stress protein n=1 Tax=Streptomyces sp. CB02959 TaxID=2020330 RepID=UPI0027E57C00|nr:universal stress protein [Streptomyces sp. CB02959]
MRPLGAPGKMEANTMDDVVTVGLDGSAESRAAARWAAEEAARRRLTLRLLHAWPMLAPEAVGTPPRWIRTTGRS